MIKRVFLLLPFLLYFHSLSCQKIYSSAYRLYTRLSFYSYEKTGEFLLHLPLSEIQKNVKVILISGNDTLSSWNGKSASTILRIPFSINLKPSVYTIDATITSPSGQKHHAVTRLSVLSYKSNEVKTDRFTGGLIVNKKEFFPFGFYTYSPVSPTLPEEEVVKGFNVISPYQKILPETLQERKAYMDRCAQLGMKVHYNLLSVSGGGGVGSKIEGLSEEEKRKRLISEIEIFRDHPALLAWYISDEPNGYKIPPETLEEIYNVVKANDPWHPVSIVFMAPFLSSKKYENALDIVMADPYPVPDLPPSMVGDVASQLKTEFKGKKPVWIAPQAFGGGEIWSREPTIQEVRSMTWQAIIKGATGIQYFVRQGLNYFPKSVAMWGECGRMAMEVAELTPWLLSDEETLTVESSSMNIVVASKIHDGKLIVMAANKKNEPVSTTIRIKGISSSTAKAIFENRTIPVNGGVISDQIGPFGTQVYLISLKPEKQISASLNNNLLKDPGFEENITPGIPSASYARPGGDRGATYFVDSREHLTGDHSLRMITPENNKSAALRFFPFKVNAGSTYIISIWAKSDPEQRIFNAANKKNNRLYDKNEMPQFVEVLIGEFGHARFVPDNEWRRYVTFVTIPADTLASFRTNLILKMPGQGIAWFDEIKVFEDK